MNRRKKRSVTALMLALMMGLSGCAMTVEQMYCVPRRSEAYSNLQSAMDEVMDDLEYSAPNVGDNRQSVQMADLTGDGEEEVLVFTKGSDENPLKILIFRQTEGEYQLLTTIESTGTAFDQVEYIQMDGRAGLELVVGRQVSSQVPGNVTVYSFSSSQPEQLVNVNYQKLLTCDLNEDGLGDLFVLRPGRTETDNGVVELYSAQNGIVERSAEVRLSTPVDQLKRIMTGRLSGGRRAVFVASTVGDDAIITDVFAIVGGVLTNVSFSNDLGTSVKTLRNYYVYAEDIDQDGELELPSLITMKSPESVAPSEREHLIRWYAIKENGDEINKKFTYHNYMQGWYLVLSSDAVDRMCVIQEATGQYSFCIWDEKKVNLTKLFTIYILTGDDRSLAAVEDGRFVIMKTETVVYAARLEQAALELGVAQEVLIENFHLIQYDWNTGEM